MRLSEGAGAQKLWELSAAHVEYREHPREADLKAVKARFYEGGKPVSSGAAPGAVLHPEAHRFELKGDVTVLARDPRTGFAAHGAVWEPQRNHLAAVGPVSFWRPGGRLTGATLTADRALRVVTLAGGVHGKLDLAPGGGLAIAPPSATILHVKKARP